jgi:hypothetical protein
MENNKVSKALLGCKCKNKNNDKAIPHYFNIRTMSAMRHIINL